MTDRELQSQRLSAQKDRLFCDLKTDEEKAAFFLSGRGYESGVIALSIQNDVAMAYHRCSEYRKEMEALQAECERLRKALVEARDLVAEWGGYASDYFKEKHGLGRDIARLDAVITTHRKQGGEK